MVKRFEVKGEAKDKIKSLSKGNQQKVQLICTLIHEPKLVILDEPFSGLDPVNADLLKKEIIRTKENGAAIIFSSHDMNNVEELCDHVVMLRNGNVVLNGSVDEIRNQFGKKHVFVLPDGIRLTPVVAGIITFSLNTGAYASETIRGAILSIPDGQWKLPTH
ncbi:Vitamin B12 import ATP-binding protein BtuD [Apilactobacillus kunkeei]|nr:Vitamin B12 import ATP-binding protein BtuD [Apilactobacillus kunkeei]